MCSILDLQSNQQRIASALSATIALNGYDDPAVRVLWDDYMTTVTDLSVVLGPGAPCSEVHTIAWEAYLDAYLEQHQSLPPAVTLVDARAFLGAANATLHLEQ